VPDRGRIDVVTVSRRLGHSSPAITLKVYAHLMKSDDRAAKVMRRALTKPQK
jgi:integrase